MPTVQEEHNFIKDPFLQVLSKKVTVPSPHKKKILEFDQIYNHAIIFIRIAIGCFNYAVNKYSYTLH